MTFIENNATIHTLNKEYQSENLEKKTFIKIIVTISTVLILIVLYFTISAFYPNTKKEERHKNLSKMSLKMKYFLFLQIQLLTKIRLSII